MSIRVGTYDFFAYLIGGVFFLANILYIAQKFLPIPIDIAKLSSTEFLVFGVMAYVLGHVVHQISNRLWYRFFMPKDLHKKTMKELSNELPSIKINFDDADWYTLLAYIKRNSVEMAQDVEHFHAISIMLRSTSFSLLLFSLTFGVEFFTNNYSYAMLVFSILTMILSIILVQTSVKNHKYFFRSIYQCVVALMAKPEQLPIKFHANAGDKKSPAEKNG